MFKLKLNFKKKNEYMYFIWSQASIDEENNVLKASTIFHCMISLQKHQNFYCSTNKVLIPDHLL